jgi:hypothetical protein
MCRAPDLHRVSGARRAERLDPEPRHIAKVLRVPLRELFVEERREGKSG